MLAEGSEPLEGVPAAQQNVSLYVHPERQYHINDNGWAKCKKGNVNEPKPDARTGHTYPVAYSGANPKGLPLYKIFYVI